MSDWREFALCKGMDTDIFFPEPGQRGKSAKAKAICDQCPVKESCAEFALSFPSHDLIYGIFAGMSYKARLAERKKRRAERLDGERVLSGG